MAKATKKKSIKYNDAALNTVWERYGFSKDYIQKAIRGERTGKMAEILAKEYHALAKVANKATTAAVEEKVKDLGAPELPEAK